MTDTNTQAGFSAVELLITIFIAAAFIASGYQLYVAVVRNGADSRNQTTASNIAYDYIRQYSPLATTPCSSTVSIPAPTIPSGTDLPNPSITAAISCPYAPTRSDTSLVTVTVSYGLTNPKKQVQHAVYVAN